MEALQLGDVLVAGPTGLVVVGEKADGGLGDAEGLADHLRGVAHGFVLSVGAHGFGTTARTIQTSALIPAPALDASGLNVHTSPIS